MTKKIETHRAAKPTATTEVPDASITTTEGVEVLAVDDSSQHSELVSSQEQFGQIADATLAAFNQLRDYSLRTDRLRSEHSYPRHVDQRADDALAIASQVYPAIFTAMQSITRMANVMAGRSATHGLENG